MSEEEEIILAQLDELLREAEALDVQIHALQRKLRRMAHEGVLYDASKED